MKKLFDTLSSRRVAVYVLFVILGLSLLGVFIPQNELPAFYQTRYAPWLAGLFHTFQLTNVFHTWYFIFLLIFLVVSITTCTVRRLRRLAIPFQKGPARISDNPDDYQCAAVIGEGVDEGSLERFKSGVQCRWRRVEGGYYGRRGVWGVWGEPLTHIGLILIFVAATLRLFGHHEELFVFEGEGIRLRDIYGSGYRLQVDDVKEIYDGNTGRIIEYISAVRLARGGKPVAAKEIEVNAPLFYGGLGIYQASMDARGMKGLALEVVKLAPGYSVESFGKKTFTWRVGTREGEVTGIPRDIMPLGDTGLKLLYIDYYENYKETAEGVSNDNAVFNPAVFVHVLNSRGDTAMGVIEENAPPGAGDVLRSTDTKFWEQPIELSVRKDKQPYTAGRTRVHVFASGSSLYVGGGDDYMVLALKEGYGDDMAVRCLEGRLHNASGAIKQFTFPYGARIPVKLTDGDYLFKFIGSKQAPVTGLTLARDPGLIWFYIGCALLSLGVCGAFLIRYDELFLFTRHNKWYLGARSNKGPRILGPTFEKWTAEARRLTEGGSR